jgi:hypothetical protein
MPDAHVNAALVAAGVGLPPVWLEPDLQEWISDDDWGEGFYVDLTDPQTAAGVLRQLAMWAGFDLGPLEVPVIQCHAGMLELACVIDELAFCATQRLADRPVDRGGPHSYALRHIVPGLAYQAEHTEATMVAHVVAWIGRDHSIRRALERTVKRGTLAELRFEELGRWRWDPSPDDPGDGFWFIAEPLDSDRYVAAHVVPALADVGDDPGKALAAIDAALEERDAS